MYLILINLKIIRRRDRSSILYLWLYSTKVCARYWKKTRLCINKERENMWSKIYTRLTWFVKLVRFACHAAYPNLSKRSTTSEHSDFSNIFSDIYTIVRRVASQTNRRGRSVHGPSFFSDRSEDGARGASGIWRPVQRDHAGIDLPRKTATFQTEREEAAAARASRQGRWKSVARRFSGKAAEILF